MKRSRSEIDEQTSGSDTRDAETGQSSTASKLSKRVAQEIDASNTSPASAAESANAIINRPPSSSSSSSSSMLFEGICGVLCAGGEFGMKQIDILKKRMVERGAVVKDDMDADVQYVFADVRDVRLLCETLKIKELREDVHIVSPAWIQCCLREGEISPTVAYELQRTKSEHAPLAGPGSAGTAGGKGSATPSPSKAVRKTAAACGTLVHSTGSPIRDPDVIETLQQRDREGAQVSGNESEEEHAGVVGTSNRGISAAGASGTPSRSPGKRKWNSRAFDPLRNDTRGLVLNLPLVQELEALEKIYKDTSDEYRAMSYSKACRAIENSGVRIESGEQASKLFGIGSKIARRIDEFLATGKIQKRIEMENSEQIRAIRLFQTIHGVGAETATNWFMRGLRTIEDIRKHPELLTTTQALALSHWEDMQLKIPREEVDLIECIIRKYSLLVRPRMIVRCCGSFRRGRTMCGDADFIISPAQPNHPPIDGFLSALVAKLRSVGFMKEEIRSMSFANHDPEDSETFMGFCQVTPTGPFRRIDIKVYPYHQYPSAILYFTGSTYLNRAMRLKADRMGYYLSDRGLFRCKRDTNGDPMDMERIECLNERELFDALEIDYLVPEDRDS
eukprot:ANDGO_02679.mRNA.1 putative DNA polymerase family X